MSRQRVRALVTGGAGFIGSHIVDELLNRGYDVRVIDNLCSGKLANIDDHLRTGKVDFIEGDIRDPDLVEKCVQGVSVAFHFAAITSVPFSIENPELTFDVNAGGTVNLLTSAAEAKVDKFVFASSAAVYGEPKRLPVNESHEASPISPYAESKLAAENFCLGFHQRRLLKSVVFRIFNVYGPRQCINEYSGVITQFFDCCRQGLPLTINGDGFQTRDFVNIYDVADVVVNAAERNSAEGQVLNIGSGRPTSIRKLAQEILKVEHRSTKIIYAKPRPGDIKHSFADISKARNLLGYEPDCTLEDGLQALAIESPKSNIGARVLTDELSEKTLR